MAGATTILLEANRDLNRAYALITRTSLGAPKSPDILAAKFRLLMRQQRDEQAVSTFRQLLDIDSVYRVHVLLSSVGSSWMTQYHC